MPTRTCLYRSDGLLCGTPAYAFSASALTNTDHAKALRALNAVLRITHPCMTMSTVGAGTILRISGRRHILLALNVLPLTSASRSHPQIHSSRHPHPAVMNMRRANCLRPSLGTSLINAIMRQQRGAAL